MGLLELLDNTNLLTMSPYIMGAVLLLICTVFGFFSPTNKTFDYIISAIMPLSLFCLMFVVGFLDKSDLETRFHFHRAVDVAMQSPCLILYLLMATITFIASTKKIRKIQNRS